MTDETRLSISTQETPLLQNNPSQDSQQPYPKIKNLKAKIVFLLRILIVLIAGILILYFIYSKNRKRPEPLSPYESGLSDYYCHLTPHPKLCNASMSSVTNATALQPDPALLFATSLQLAITQLNHTTASIANASRPGPGLSTCETLIRDSLSRLNGSAGLDFFSYGLVKDEVQGVMRSNIGSTARTGKNPNRPAFMLGASLITTATSLPTPNYATTPCPSSPMPQPDPTRPGPPLRHVPHHPAQPHRRFHSQSPGGIQRFPGWPRALHVPNSDRQLVESSQCFVRVYMLEPFLYEERLAITDEVEIVIKNNSGECLLALSEIDGVEQVRMGVEKGRKLLLEIRYVS
ncbi:hypothetical protein SASPL_154989 [Salvia splendens]|uniref:Pectinesterase inhibitor domain-containing protein n=1 Tax=Salvia splendens TaxID=180675 RepID=A0A8X8W1K4_SALSN|nr:hypothetical protein SASPL_154989 [Salvia splendens]